jgi:hypothetical protein
MTWSADFIRRRFQVYVDDIAHLREADFFYHLIEAELVSRNHPSRENIRKNPSYVAKVVATRYVSFIRETCVIVHAC